MATKTFAEKLTAEFPYHVLIRVCFYFCPDITDEVDVITKAAAAAILSNHALANPISDHGNPMREVIIAKCRQFNVSLKGRK